MLKVNVFYMGKQPLADRFFKVIQPQLSLPVFKRKVLSLSSYAKQEHVDKLETPNHVYSLDYRHWYYDDTVFDAYITDIANMRLPYLFVFDKPFDHERPWKISIEEFSKRLAIRAQKVASTMRQFSPETKLISPWISVLSPECRDAFHQFMVKFCDLFDIYSVLCSNDMTDISSGMISSFLVDVVHSSKKPAWLLCAISASDYPVVQVSRSVKEKYKPFSEQAAVFKLKQLYELFNKITDSTLFYFGIEKDVFLPDKEPGILDNRIPLDMYMFEKEWSWCHYLGMMYHDNRIKTKLLRGLLDLAEKENV